MEECLNKTQMPQLKKTGALLLSGKSDKVPNKLGLPFMVTNIVHKFQMTCLIIEKQMWDVKMYIVMTRVKLDAGHNK